MLTVTFGPTVEDVPFEIVTPDVEEETLPNVKAFCLLLNVVQSVEESSPLFVADAVGILNVCVVPTEEMLKSVPVEPVVRSCAAAIKPFRAAEIVM